MDDYPYAVVGASQHVSATATEWARPSVMFRPTLTLDGDQYCALYGSDLMGGVAGFGKTAAKAMRDFDERWHNQKAPTPAMVSVECDRCHNMEEIELNRGECAEGGIECQCCNRGTMFPVSNPPQDTGEK